MFYLSLGAPVTAHAHLCTAYQAFMDWGAIAKVKALVHRLPFVDFDAAGAHRSSGSSLTSLSNASVHAQIDVESIVKASRALSTETGYGASCCVVLQGTVCCGVVIRLAHPLTHRT